MPNIQGKYQFSRKLWTKGIWKGNKSKWLLRAEKNLKIMGFFLHDKNNMTIIGAKIQAKISISGGEKGVMFSGSQPHLTH